MWRPAVAVARERPVACLTFFASARSGNRERAGRGDSRGPDLWTKLKQRLKTPSAPSPNRGVIGEHARLDIPQLGLDEFYGGLVLVGVLVVEERLAVAVVRVQDALGAQAQLLEESRRARRRTRGSPQNLLEEFRGHLPG